MDKAVDHNENEGIDGRRRIEFVPIRIDTLPSSCRMRSPMSAGMFEFFPGMRFASEPTLPPRILERVSWSGGVLVVAFSSLDHSQLGGVGIASVPTYTESRFEGEESKTAKEKKTVLKERQSNQALQTTSGAPKLHEKTSVVGRHRVGV